MNEHPMQKRFKMENNIERNLLDLPDEVLDLIVRQVTDHKSLRLASKKLYDVSCRVKFYTLKVERKYETADVWSCNLLDDQTNLQTLLDSKKRFNRIEITGSLPENRCFGTFHTFEYRNHVNKMGWLIGFLQFPTKLTKFQSSQIVGLSKVLEKFGWHVKSLKVEGLDFDEDSMKLLNLLPELKTLELKSTEASTVSENFQLKLEKLQELIAIDSIGIVQLVKVLPCDVLRKVLIRQKGVLNMDCDSSTKLFRNQRNIKELDVDQHSIKYFDYRAMKLETLACEKVNSRIDNYVGSRDLFPLKEAIRGQSELRKLVCNRKDSSVESLRSLLLLRRGDLETICSELTSLEELHVSIPSWEDALDVSEFASFSKLSKLIKLKMKLLSSNLNNGEEHFNRCLSLMENASLRELQLGFNGLKETTKEILHRNLPQLQRFQRSFVIDTFQC